MIEQSLNGVFRAPLLDRRGDNRRIAAYRYGALATVRALDRTPWEWSLRSLSDVLRLTGRMSHRTKTTEIAPLGAIGRLATAIRTWQQDARSWQELRALSDHMLKDIGLRREELGYELPKLLWRWD